jgi:hypothetical protein
MLPAAMMARVAADTVAQTAAPGAEPLHSQ